MVDVMKLQRNVTRYELADGIRDFHSAVWLLTFGIYAWLVFDRQLLWGEFVVTLTRTQGQLFATFVIFGVALAIPMLITQGGLWFANVYIRRRWLWRETGFVKPKSWVMPRSVLFAGFVLMFGVFIGGIFLAMATGDFWIIIRSLYVGTGISSAFMYWQLSRVFDIPRYRVMAGVGFVGTAILGVLPLSVGLICLLISAFWAGILVVSGVVGMREVAAIQKRLADAA